MSPASSTSAAPVASQTGTFKRYTAKPNSTASTKSPTVGTTISGFSARVRAVSTANTACTSTSASQEKAANSVRAVGETARSAISVMETPRWRSEIMRAP